MKYLYLRTLKKYAQVAESFGANVPFLRPKKYAMDRTTTEATLQNALLDYEKHQNKKYDICVFLTSNKIFEIIIGFLRQ